MPITHLREMAAESAPGKQVQYATPTQTGSAILAVLRGVFAAGSGNPPHRHDREEIVFIVGGRGVYTIGPETFVVAPGDLVVVPDGVTHSFEATEDMEAIGFIAEEARTFETDESEPVEEIGT